MSEPWQARFERAHLLLERRRTDEAIAELRGVLAERPENAHARCLLARCLLWQDALAEALEEARTAVGDWPDSAYAQATLGEVLLARDDLELARTATRRALELDPMDVDSYSLMARIDMANYAWQEVLDWAEAGLEIDAEHTDCNNLRAQALVSLGRRDEARGTLDATLHREPESSGTHANMGWTLLNDRDPRAAAEHFREALRLDPENDFARAGIVEAIKARNPIYSILLRYFLWMGRLPPRLQWAFLIGLFVAYRVVRSIAEASPELEPYVMPVVVAYLGFVGITWLSGPLFNLTLLLHPVGRVAITPTDRLHAIVTGVLLAAGLGCALAGVTIGPEPLLWLGACVALLVFPTTGAIQGTNAGGRVAMGSVAGGAAVMAAVWFVMELTSPPGPSGLLTGAMVLSALSTWATNFVISER